MCVFCKIIAGEIPSRKIYEDEATLAFLDIEPDYVGHTLVIPKRHCENVLDCDTENLSHVIKTVQLVAKHYVNNCGFDGIDLLNANGSAAGQTVSHLHFHMIPKKENDPIEIWPKRKISRDMETEHKTFKF
jgi:histidine triad (HIT) family protein